jgi:hypothetical protein
MRAVFLSSFLYCLHVMVLGKKISDISPFILYIIKQADHSGDVVQAMKYLRLLKHWDRGFESNRDMDVCPYFFCLCCHV